MKVDGGIGNQLDKAGQQAADLEKAGYSGGWTAETSHDPFLPLLLAAEHTTDLELGTSIAVAFARNPMTLANLAWDLQTYSKGRFILGLGSQIKPHITKRFSMEWSHPAARMREMILAIRAIWDTWENGTKLDFRGDFYTHTLMTPFFTPDKSDLGDFGVPKIYLAGVGELMTEVAGEVCDGFLCHGFTTEKYLREVTIPALERGRAKAGKTMDGFEIVGPSFVVTGTNDEELDAAAAASICSSLVPVTTNDGPMISKPSIVLPALARPRSRAGIVTSRRYRSVVKPWQRKPSHTSPATSVISSPTPASMIFALP